MVEEQFIDGFADGQTPVGIRFLDSIIDSFDDVRVFLFHILLSETLKDLE